MKWRDYIKETSFSTIDINERFKLLNKPHNTYCQKNYIDYNSVVDKIIQLSQPYGADNKGNMIIKEDNSFDALQMNSIQPLYPQTCQKMNHNEANDPLVLNNNSRLNSFISVLSKKDDQEENNFLDLINSKSNIMDNMQSSVHMKQQPSEFFANFYSNQLRREPSSNIFDSSNLFSMNKQQSNLGDSRLLQNLALPANNVSVNGEFFKSFSKDNNKEF